ncbi:MAG: flagella synthesis protein FlgN [Cellvibrio sp.]
MTVQASHIQQMLEIDTQSVDKLKALLEREKTLIETRQLQELGELIDEKTAIISHLDQHARIRHQVLIEAGLSTDPTGWNNYLDRIPGAGALREGWLLLNRKFQECQTLNEINGKLIARSAQTIDHLLNLLRGQTPSPSLYTAKGNRLQENGSVTIARA